MSGLSKARRLFCIVRGVWRVAVNVNLGRRVSGGSSCPLSRLVCHFTCCCIRSKRGLSCAGHLDFAADPSPPGFDRIPRSPISLAVSLEVLQHMLCAVAGPKNDRLMVPQLNAHRSLVPKSVVQYHQRCGDESNKTGFHALSHRSSGEARRPISTTELPEQSRALKVRDLRWVEVTL